MRLTRIAEPAGTAVSLPEAKRHCRVDHDDEDLHIETLIHAVTDFLDGPSGILGRAILAQTWLLELESWPTTVALPIEPVASVAVSWLDEDGEETTVPGTAYDLISNPSAKPLLQMKPETQAPELGSQTYPVRITMTAGWATANAVPASLKVAMLMLIEHWYERGATDAGALPMPVNALLGRWRVLL